MQFLNEVRQKGVTLLMENATTLLTAGGVVGTVATAVLTGRASFKAAEILDEAKYRGSHDVHGDRIDTDSDPYVMPKTEVLKLVGPQFIPPIAMGAFTIASIIMAHRMSAQKVAALAAAYGLAERNLSDYKEKVAEKLTGPKKQSIDDEIAQDRVNETPGYDKVIIVEGEGDVLCMDLPTGRYFKSSPEKIRRAENATNAEILRHGGVQASYFYDELELPTTSWSDEVGWGMGEQLEVVFSYVEAPNQKPCLAIDFKKLPTAHWTESYT